MADVQVVCDVATARQRPAAASGGGGGGDRPTEHAACLLHWII